jgi:VIT1/CCC1 family predicted Fe2+/Mn2+ transporter
MANGKKFPVKSPWAAKVHDLILGGQDGLVNVLGVVLGVAAATLSTRVVLIAGLAATFAESISMGAVAYTSAKAAKEYSVSIGRKPPQEYADPIASGVTVGLASLAGSFIPLLPFFLLPVGTAIVWSLVICTFSLFIAGAAKANLTIGTWWKSGIELAAIGMLAAFAGYAIGHVLGVTI